MIELPDFHRTRLRVTITAAPCEHGTVTSPPCPRCAAAAVEPLLVDWLVEAHRDGQKLSIGHLRLYRALLTETMADARRYHIAWRSARRRAAARPVVAEPPRPRRWGARRRTW